MFSLIEERGFMRVSDLSNIFGISEVTVRSDLDHPDASPRIQRVHGGAMVREGLSHVEQTFEQSEVTSADEKAAIGEAAAALVMPGESLIIDVGTTTTAVARALARRRDLEDVVVFTNGLTIAAELEPEIPRISVILTGGRLRPRQHSLVDPLAGLILEQVNVTTAFVGCTGVHPDEGITNINLPEAAVKTLMIKAAHRVVVVAEGPKLGRISVARFADLADVDLLVTGPSAPPELLTQIRERGVDTKVTG
jgi:DeoR family transcriptional regulator of aga operon